MTVPNLAKFSEDVLAGNRAALARAITLIESAKPDHRAEAQELLGILLPFSGKSLRVGITGVPGVGKSTLIDRLGTMLTADGHRVAVLAVDPSSARTGGSILGDKTRMVHLSRDPRAFIRPSPTGGTLGGVARRTRDTIILAEAAGHDIVFVETVGVGQSETAVASMVDCFVVLLLPGAGDELQGLKKGLIEIADVIAITKADGEALGSARRAAADYLGALSILQRGDGRWRTPVILVSAIEGDGIAELWRQIMAYTEAQRGSGDFLRRRREQLLTAFREELEERVLARFVYGEATRALLPELMRRIGSGEITPTAAVEELIGRATHSGSIHDPRELRTGPGGE
jgi:LAO/AO transport system kinase